MRQRTGFCLGWLALASIAACGGLSQERASENANPEVVGAGSGGSSTTAASSNGGTSSSQPTASSGGSSSTTTPPHPTPTRPVPEKHRALATTCDHQRPPGNARSYSDPIPCPQDGGSCPTVEGCSICRSACIDYGEGLGPQCVTSNGECVSDADCTANDNGRCNNNREYWSCSYDTCYSDATCTSGGPCACEGESGSLGNTCLSGNCRTDADCPGSGYCSPTLGGCGNYGGVVGYYCHTAADTCLDDADCASPTQGPGYCLYAPEVGHWSCGYGQCVG
ncbi:MAG TPA: hypothetical protein VJU61_08580 [Polyangiaceae bacterium]|nr:hypothetical protein [Polyangiaceae bacterium]